jgi:hypothetical protein
MNSERKKLVLADPKSSSDIDYSNSKVPDSIAKRHSRQTVRATTGACSRKELTWLQSGGHRWKTKVLQVVVLNMPAGCGFEFELVSSTNC